MKLKLAFWISFSLIIGEFAHAEDQMFSPIGVGEKSQKELPSSVTVITRADIETLGLTEVTDIFALIPGVSVTKRSAAIYVASYHGTNPTLPRRTKFTIDGMSLQSVGTASYNWAAFPVSIEDIERVEVYRNQVEPKSGSKTLLATINIVTRNPKDNKYNSLSIHSATLGRSMYSAKYSGDVGVTHFNIRAEKANDDGYDRVVRIDDFGGRVDASQRDGLQSTKLNIRSSSEINDTANFDVLAGFMTADSDLEIGDSNAIGDSNRGFDQYFGQTTLGLIGDSDEFHLSLSTRKYDETKEWKTCYPLIMFTDELRAVYQSNPDYAAALLAGRLPTGGSQQDDILALKALQKFRALGASAVQPECGNINENFSESKNIVDLENTHVFNDSFVLTAGYEYQSNDFSSRSLTVGKVAYTSHNVHATAHTDLTDSLGMSFGGNYATTSMMGEDDGGASYHLGLNYDYFDNHTIKLVYTNTHRSPAPLERHLNWSYYMTDFSIPLDGRNEGYFYRSTNSKAYPVENENFSSVEANFSGYIGVRDLEYDVKIFSEKMTDLISQDLYFTNFKPTNESETELNGVETLLKYRLGAFYKIQVGGSYIDNDSTNVNEKSMWMKTIGYVALMYSGFKNQYSFAYYGSSGVYQDSFDRMEANYRREFSVGKSSPYLNVKLRYEPSDVVLTAGRINASGSERSAGMILVSYDNATSIHMGVGVNF